MRNRAAIHAYRIELPGPPEAVFGASQSLSPRDNLRLGMQVVVRHEGARAIIDWQATCGGQTRDNILLEPDEIPPPGIDDGRQHRLLRARERWRPALATIVEEPRTPRLLEIDGTWVAEVTGEDGTTHRLKIRPGPPYYAFHLGTVGTVLPAWIGDGRKPKVQIDWVVAAERVAAGEPPTGA